MCQGQLHRLPRCHGKVDKRCKHTTLYDLSHVSHVICDANADDRVSLSHLFVLNTEPFAKSFIRHRSSLLRLFVRALYGRHQLGQGSGLGSEFFVHRAPTSRCGILKLLFLYERR